MIHGRNMISIWFFIGVLVLLYGVIILGWELSAADTPSRDVKSRCPSCVPTFGWAAS